MPQARPLNPDTSFVYIIYQRSDDKQFFESIFRNNSLANLVHFLETTYDRTRYYWQIYSLHEVKINLAKPEEKKE